MKTKTKIAEWNTYWLSMASPHLRHTTVDQYRDVLEHILNPSIGHFCLSEFNAGHAQQFVIDELKRNRGLSRLKLAVIVEKMAFEEAFEEGMIPYNAFRLLRLPRGMKKETAILYSSDIRAMMTDHAGLPYTPLFVIIYLLALRIGEALGLMWKDIDFENREVLISRQLTRTRHNGHVLYQLDNYTKNDVIDTVDLNDLSVCWFQIQKQRQENWSGLHHQYCNPEGYVFTDEYGSRLNYDKAYYQFNKLMALIGRPDVTPHSLRHTAASVALYTTENRLFVSEFLRDRSLQAVDTYAQPTYEQQLGFARALHKEFSALIRCAIGEEYCHD